MQSHELDYKIQELLATDMTAVFTAQQLSEKLAVSMSLVGNRLRVLTKAGLIQCVKTALPQKSTDWP